MSTRATRDERDASPLTSTSDLPRTTRGVSAASTPLAERAEVRAELDSLLARFVPPHIVINDDYEIVQFHGHAGRFLELAPGRATLNLLDMSREGLKQPLRTMLRAASRRNGPARKRNVKVKTNEGVESVDIEVARLQACADKPWFLVMFESNGRTTCRRRATDHADGETNRLHKELAEIRDVLRITVEQQEITNSELRSANEEVQAANEELHNINEELETSRDELQSSNVELSAINTELLNRTVELSGLNSELNSVLSSIRLAVVLVDKELRIKRISSPAGETLNVIPGDIGRPLGDLSLKVSCPDLQQELQEVIASGVSKKFEVLGNGGSRYALSLHPYLTEESKIDGVAIVATELASRQP